MEYLVTCKLDDIETPYEVEATGHYDAKVKALTRFLVDNKIPGRPWEYLTAKRRGMISVAVQSKDDSRRGSRPGFELDYFLEQADRLKDQVRESTLADTQKRTAVKLLRNLEKVLSGEIIQ